MARSTRTASSRWAECAEIWDELEDRSTPEPISPAFSRRRSTTLPMNRNLSSFPFARRGTTDSHHLTPSGEVSGETEPLVETARRDFKRRRKSTGFPGFTARRNTARRTSGGGIQGPPRSFLGFRWWGSRPGSAGSPRARSTSWAAVPWYRDDPEAGLAGSSSTSERRSPQGPGPRSSRQDDSPV